MNAPIDRDPLDLAVQIARVFESIQVRYLIGGSLASTTFGEPRATLDVDLVADLSGERIDAFLTALGDEFTADRSWIEDEVGRRGSFQLVHLPSMTRVDVFVPEWTGVHLWKWQSRRRVVVSNETGEAVDVTGPEGIVVQKLVWFRDGGEVSDTQWRDVVGVLKVQHGQLRMDELRTWATRLSVDALLARALQAAGADEGGV